MSTSRKKSAAVKKSPAPRPAAKSATVMAKAPAAATKSVLDQLVKLL